VLYRSPPLVEYDPLAVCNDGSSMYVYFKPATRASQATTWLLYLAGGEWCWSASSCAARFLNANWEMSSSKWAASKTLGGLFDGDPYRSPMAGVNLAYVGYCSSDAWVGDAAASALTGGFAFRGQRAVPAALLWLTRVHAFGAAGIPERLLLAGSSAGGRGVLFTIDYLQPLVPPSVNIHAFADSALWLDVPQLAAGSAPSLQAQTQMALPMLNATSRLDPLCTATYGLWTASATSAAWKCLYTQYRIPFLRVPYLLAEAQFDSFALPAFAGAPAPYLSPNASQFALSYAATAALFLSSLPLGDQPYSGVWSAACYTSCPSDSAAFYKLAVYPSAANRSSSDAAAAPTTLAEALKLWFWANQVPMRIVDRCALDPQPAFACGVCRNRTQPPYARFVAERRAERPPAPAAPPPVSRLRALNLRALLPYALILAGLLLASGVGGAYARATQAAAQLQAERRLQVDVSEASPEKEGIEALIARMRAGLDDGRGARAAAGKGVRLYGATERQDWGKAGL